MSIRDDFSNVLREPIGPGDYSRVMKMLDSEGKFTMAVARDLIIALAKKVEYLESFTNQANGQSKPDTRRINGGNF